MPEENRAEFQKLILKSNIYKTTEEIMTREEIIQQGAPVEPNCFETDREEQWYKAGLYEGATASPWNELIENGPRILDNADILVRFTDGTVRRYDEEFPEILVTHWMEIPELPEKGDEQ